MLQPFFFRVLRGQSDLARSGPARPLWTLSYRTPPKFQVVVRLAACDGAYPYRADRLRRQTMQKGTVKWFNPTKGYGFIRPSTGDKDVFVHLSAVERAGLTTLNEGQSIEFELVTNRGRTSAENLKTA